MLAKGTIIGNPTFIAVFTLLNVAVLLQPVQEQMIKFVPQSVSEPVVNFTYVTGVTPLTEIKYPISFCCFYLILIFTLQAWMKNRSPWNLDVLRISHNFLLCFGSMLMMFGMAKGTFLVFQKYGEEALFCDANVRQKEGHLYFWYYVFFLSKFYEFIDTIILVLRKKDLTFLHVFHHFITAILCWVALYNEIPVQWLVCILNATVHIFMYYYYLATTLNSDVWWKKYLTTAQIIQFVVDLLGISVWWYYYLVKEQPCTGTVASMLFVYFVLGSFLILFVLFYIKTFKRPASGSRAPKAQKQN
mmetsp:Transcript_21408/g.29951  ORF Transcript_21408/g.29951 Transcript_21408/m.29951 type:complete len:302 (+) Transcript_21408:23-928(+)